MNVVIFQWEKGDETKKTLKISILFYNSVAKSPKEHKITKKTNKHSMMRKKRKNENKDEITRLKMRGKVHFIKCNDPRSI